MEIKIETATPRILDIFFKIERQCFNEEAFTRQQIAYLLVDYNTVALTAKIAGEVAGFVIAQIDTDSCTEFGHIVTLNVAPSFRRRGVATRLLCEMENLLRGRGISECRLEVREDNHSAIKLYYKLGYGAIGKLERYYGRKHGLYLKKVL